MSSSLKWTLLGVGGVLLLTLLAVGGYFVYTTLSEVHEENVDHLSEFGSKVIPLSETTITRGTQGQLQLPPSITPEKRSQSERVILALSREKEQLMEELTIAKERIKELEAELGLLTAYREDNERFAPRPMRVEQERAHDYLSQYLTSRPEAKRFTRFEQRAMALGGSWVYRQMLIRYRLSFSETQKDQLLQQHLPAFSFCLGDGIGFVANNQAEREALLDYYETGDDTRLSVTLREDLETISRPCIQQLNSRVNQLLGLAQS